MTNAYTYYVFAQINSTIMKKMIKSIRLFNYRYLIVALSYK